MHEKKAKIISLVPSWTETLIAAGADVVGRSRFCIHPAAAVAKIPVIGGTKSLKIEEIKALGPDFVILDKEENKFEMAEALHAAGIEMLVSQVTDIPTAAEFLDRLAAQLNLPALAAIGQRYRDILNCSISQEKFLKAVVIKSNAAFEIPLEYVIWKDPFMVIGNGTFIAAVLKLAGVPLARAEKYPKVEDAEIKKGFCLFSTEPFPFARSFAKLTAAEFRGALVDGEKISWYGIRNLTFLESCRE